MKLYCLRRASSIELKYRFGVIVPVRYARKTIADVVSYLSAACRQLGYDFGLDEARRRFDAVIASDDHALTRS
jgi:hypothetical protein